MIKLVRQALFVFWMLILLILGFWLGHENDQIVGVVLFGLSMPELSLGTYLVVMLWSGIAIGFTASFFLTQGVLFLKKRELKKVKTEVATLKSSAAD